MRRLRDDAGAVTVLVALLLPVVLLGMAALALDVGSMYVQKRQLQNGADAAALGVAGDCASQPLTCTQGTASTTANTFANRNANAGPGNFGAATAPLLCGTITGLTPCPSGEAPDPALIEGFPYVKARTNASNAPLFGQFLGYGGQDIEAEATVALSDRRALMAARAPFALCADNTEAVPGYPTTGIPLIVKSGSDYVANDAAIGQKYPLWSNGNSESNAATNKCGLGSEWKGWIADELYTLPGWVDKDNGSAVGDLTYITEANKDCVINVNNGQISGDCRFIIPICTIDAPSPAEGDLYCPLWGAFEFTDIKPSTSTEPNGWKTIYGEFLGGRQVDGGQWSTEPPREGDPFIMAPRMVG